MGLSSETKRTKNKEQKQKCSGFKRETTQTQTITARLINFNRRCELRFMITYSAGQRPKAKSCSNAQFLLQSKHMLARPDARMCMRHTCARVSRIAWGEMNCVFVMRDSGRRNHVSVRLSRVAQNLNTVVKQETVNLIAGLQNCAWPRISLHTLRALAILCGNLLYSCIIAFEFYIMSLNS